jgi:hypothetical protein
MYVARLARFLLAMRVVAHKKSCVVLKIKGATTDETISSLAIGMGAMC